MRIQAFINGLLVGLILGVLYAPSSGNETRRRITRRASDLRESLQDTYADLSDKVSGTVNQIKDTAGALKRGPGSGSTYREPSFNQTQGADPDITV